MCVDGITGSVGEERMERGEEGRPQQGKDERGPVDQDGQSLEAGGLGKTPTGWSAQRQCLGGRAERSAALASSVGP